MRLDRYFIAFLLFTGIFAGIGLKWLAVASAIAAVLMLFFASALNTKRKIGRLVRAAYWPFFRRIMSRKIDAHISPFIGAPLLMWLNFEARKEYIKFTHNEFIDLMAIKGDQICKEVEFKLGRLANRLAESFQKHGFQLSDYND